MTTLTSLIRLRKHTVDQKQKFLSGLYRQAEALEAKKNDLKSQVARERQLLEEQEMLEALAWFGHYAAGVKTQISLIDKDLANLEKRIEIARADLRTAYGEMKKVEIIHKRREEEAVKEELRRESKEMDEIGVEGHRRKALSDE